MTNVTLSNALGMELENVFINNLTASQLQFTSSVINTTISFATVSGASSLFNNTTSNVYIQYSTLQLTTYLVTGQANNLTLD